MISRREWLRASLGGAAALFVSRRGFAATPPTPIVTVYKDAGCECCNKWIKHLTANGFVVNPHDVKNVDEIKRTMNVPTALQSCHTALVGPFVVEGHVPADLIHKMLKDKPSILGLAVPGMPNGAPGMETGRVDPYDVIAFTRDGQSRVYANR
jgi:hypothetical protein